MLRSDSSIRLRNLVISLATFVALVLFASTYSEPVLRVSIIPDESTMMQRRKLKPLIDYLENKIGIKIEFRPVSDGDALVKALLANKLDMVWFDGFNFIRARTHSNDRVIPIVQRTEDQQTRSVFITAHAGISRLEDLKGKTFSFGAKSSASGHLMPRSFLRAAYMDPDMNMKHIEYSGTPEATVAAVSSGKIDAGVLGSISWGKLVEQGKVDPKTVRVFYTTPAYSDFSWAVHADMDVNLRLKLTDAFLMLDMNNGMDKAILDLQRASKFVPAYAESFLAIETAASSAGINP